MAAEVNATVSKDSNKTVFLSVTSYCPIPFAANLCRSYVVTKSINNTLSASFCPMFKALWDVKFPYELYDYSCLVNLLTLSHLPIFILLRAAFNIFSRIKRSCSLLFVQFYPEKISGKGAHLINFLLNIYLK